MLNILEEDDHILVVVKPAGIESQGSRGFEPDMVSEIRKHLHMLCTKGGQPYVGVIHRLDKPVSGILVYAKTSEGAASLSRQLQTGIMKKKYYAVVCGKPVDIVGNYVDNLLRDGKSNYSQIVDKGITGAKRAELRYEVLETAVRQERELSLVRIELLTGRHHQIRVQLAGHGTPLWGDAKYNPLFAPGGSGMRGQLALCAYELSFQHPGSGKGKTYRIKPGNPVFTDFRFFA